MASLCNDGQRDGTADANFTDTSANDMSSPHLQEEYQK